MQDQSDTQRKRSGFRMLIGYRTKVWREGYGEVELPLGAQHLNSLGVVHGGVFAALLDVALGHAVSFSPVPGNTRYSTTVSLTTNFLKGATGGTLTASGRLRGARRPDGHGLGRGARREPARCWRWRRAASSISPAASSRLACPSASARREPSGRRRDREADDLVALDQAGDEARRLRLLDEARAGTRRRPRSCGPCRWPAARR